MPERSWHNIRNMVSLDRWVEACVNTLKEFGSLYENESERGQAILAGCEIDDLLAEFLSISLRDNKGKDFLTKGTLSPMSSMAAKSALCFSLGLIDETEYQAIDALRKIRNHFAHNKNARYSDDRVVSLEHSLNKAVSETYDPQMDAMTKDARSRFTLSFIVLVIRLRTRLAQARKTRFPVNADIHVARAMREAE